MSVLGWTAGYLTTGVLMFPVATLIARTRISPRPTLRRAFWPNHYVRLDGSRAHGPGRIMGQIAVQIVLWPWTLLNTIR